MTGPIMLSKVAGDLPAGTGSSSGTEISRETESQWIKNTGAFILLHLTSANKPEVPEFAHGF
jgi:hypothetical protein